MIRSKKILLTIFLLVFISGCSRPVLFKETRTLMSTFCEISCYHIDQDIVLNAMDNAFNEIKRLENIFNKYDKESEISKVNKLMLGEKLKISPELFEVIEESIYYSELSEGSFDVTTTAFGYKNIFLNKEERTVSFLSEGIEIDLGGIAKGYVVDKVKEILISNSIDNALINIGGNIYALGSPPGKDAWQIGVRDPHDKDNIIETFYLKDRAISTSGNYERGLHIIDPIKGWFKEEAMSVSIIASSAQAADVLSTAVFVKGKDEGMAMIGAIKGVEVYIYD
ncbi:MAG: FAD:protein FMN transferase [Candidatus Omnitrophota bacterium]